MSKDKTIKTAKVRETRVHGVSKYFCVSLRRLNGRIFQGGVHCLVAWVFHE